MDNRYVIEAENEGGTFEAIDCAGIYNEAEHIFRKCANLETMRPQGARELTLGDKLTGTIIAIWVPQP